MAPPTTTAGATIAPAVQVEVRDAAGRTAAAFTGDVTVAIAANSGGGTLSGTTTVAAVAGVATFSTLSIDKSGTGYTLTASAAGLPDAPSAPFAITAGTAAQLAFAVQPRATAAGVPLAPAVQVAAQDALGNTVPGFSGSVTLAITAGTGTGGATLSGATAVNAVAGVATFSTLSIDLIGTDASGTGYTLSATTTGLVAATSDVFDITAGSASHLVFTVQPSTTGAGAHIAPPVQVTARDASGNTVSTFTGSVTVALGTNPGGTLSGTTTVAAFKGVATFSTLSVDHVGSYSLVATAGGLTSGASSGFAITHGPATRLVFTQQPGTTTVGAAITPPVQIAARDALGNTATGFNGNVTVAIATNPASGTLAGTRTVAAIGGIATFPGLSIDQVGSYRLSAVAAGLSPDTSAAFDILVSAPIQLAFTVQPTTTTAGATITPAIRVIARDLSGQTTTSFTGDVTLAIAAGTGASGVALLGTTTVAAVGGVATFSDLHIDKSGSGYELIATASGLSAATSASFNITSGAATQLVFSVQPSTATAHAAITPQVEVTARDALGNTAQGFAGTVTVAIAGGTGASGATLSGTTTLAAVAGVAPFATLSIDRAGTGYQLTATGGGLPAVTSNLFDITAGAGTHLVLAVQPSTTPAGAPITPAVQVAAKDALGNTVTGFTGDVTVTITGGTGAGGATLSGGTTVAAVAGVATFSSLSIDKSGTGYTLSATAAGLSGTTSVAFAVTSGAVARLVFTVQPVSTTAGAIIMPAVQVSARDAQNNTVDTFTGTVSVAIGVNPAGGILSGTKAVAAVGGVATFGSLSIDKAGSGYALSASATAVTGASSAAFTITSGPASQLGFTVQPSTTTAGTGITPAVEVTARDARGNTVPGFTGNVTVAIGTNPGGSTLSGTTTVAAASGVARLPGLSINKSGTGYTLTATAGGLSAATSASFDVIAGAATQLAFMVPPVTTTAGATIRPSVRVTALDALGNTAPAFAGNVTLAIGTNPASGTLSGTRTFAGIAGVATFPGLSIDSAGVGYRLTASAPGLTGVNSPAFDIVPSTPSRLFFTVEPTDTANSVTAGVVITPAVLVSARDVSGQVVTSFTGDVTLAIAVGTGTSGATLLGTTTVVAVGGVASFSDLKIDLAGGGYKLNAMAGGLPAVTSSFFNVTAGPATQLAFTVQPSTATAKATIAPQIEVTARDALGNTADGFAGHVTVAIAGGPGGATLSGTTTAAAVAGVAAFSPLSIDKSGTGYTLAAAAPGLTAATSAPFEITAARATELVFTVQPASRTAGATIAPAVQVTARNAAGQTATGFTGNVTLAIPAGTGTSDATLSGARTVAAVAGVATFPSLSIDRSGSGYKLSATATGLAGATSDAFTINPGAPSQLVFTQQPGATVAGATITPPVQVTVRDALGNPVKTFTGDVELSIAAGANPGNGTLSGTTTVAAGAGVASFNDLSIDRTGVGYRLLATAGGVSSATSDAFVIAPGPATLLVFSVQPSSAGAGATIKPNVRVAAFDALGNAATDFTGSVTVAIMAGTGTSGATLSGTTTLTAVSGVAQFPDLKIDLRGSAYRLSATAGGTAGAASTPFDIN